MTKKTSGIDLLAIPAG